MSVMKKVLRKVGSVYKDEMISVRGEFLPELSPPLKDVPLGSTERKLYSEI